MTQIDDLVKDARTMAIAMDKTFKDSNAANTWRAVANALESQAAELTRLRERNAELENALVLYRDAVRIDPTMEGPRFMGANSSALRRAWEHDLASSESVVKSEGENDGVE